MRPQNVSNQPTQATEMWRDQSKSTAAEIAFHRPPWLPLQFGLLVCGLNSCHMTRANWVKVAHWEWCMFGHQAIVIMSLPQLNPWTHIIQWNWSKKSQPWSIHSLILQTSTCYSLMIWVKPWKWNLIDSLTDKKKKNVQKKLSVCHLPTQIGPDHPQAGHWSHRHQAH